MNAENQNMNDRSAVSQNTANPLGNAPVGRLLLKFTVPSIVAMLVSSLYNMVDQIFIGNFVNYLGNAATNIAFPLSMLCTATALTFGIGGAAAFNLTMGAGDKEKAGFYIGNSIVGMLAVGLILTLISEIFLTPLLNFFGAPEDVLPYACDYTRVTAIGFPILILSIGGGHLIRADGKPTVAMICNLSGALVNTGLDALFVIVFHWGMTGAALATVIGQCVAAGLILFHLGHFKTVRLQWKHFVPKVRFFGRTVSLGMSQGFNQLAMMVVQITMNNSLKYYGGLSVYGENIPISVVGVATKMAMVYFSFCIGISQGMQPIASYNYGAGQYPRTKSAYNRAWLAGTVVSVVAFALFQLFPRQIVGLFGGGSEAYFEFAVKYFRIYMFCTFVNNVQPLTSNFFSSIGKPVLGLILSLTRQILFLLPLIVIFPQFWGIEGLLYAGPIADGLAFVISFVFARVELARKEYRKELSQ